MNQILVTKKLYITPELKRKKKIYKFNFFLSVFLVCTLMSIYIYAEYDRSKNEEKSQELLATIQLPEEDETLAENMDFLLIGLDNDEEVIIENTSNNIQIQEIEKEEELPDTNLASEIQSFEGYSYKVIGSINIPKISVTYPIIDGQTDSVAETDALLRISPVKFWGPDFNEEWGQVPNQEGNLCIVAHNYRNEKFFSKVPTLVNGDIIEITDVNGNIEKYSVYDKFEVDPNDNSSTTQNTNGETEITLITCTNDNALRVIVKARKI